MQLTFVEVLGIRLFRRMPGIRRGACSDAIGMWPMLFALLNAPWFCQTPIRSPGSVGDGAARAGRGFVHLCSHCVAYVATLAAIVVRVVTTVAGLTSKAARMATKVDA